MIAVCGTDAPGEGSSVPQTAIMARGDPCQTAARGGRGPGRTVAARGDHGPGRTAIMMDRPRPGHPP